MKTRVQWIAAEKLWWLRALDRLLSFRHAGQLETAAERSQRQLAELEAMRAGACKW